MQSLLDSIKERIDNAVPISSSQILQIGMDVYENKPTLLASLEYLPITEEIYIAALEAKSTEWAKVFYKFIQNEFPDSLKLVKLKGMKYEADGNFERALEHYQKLIDGNPQDSRIIKRAVAIHKEMGNIGHAIRVLTKYLQVYSNDLEAWLELGQIYLARQDYEKAQYCYEELLTSFQDDPQLLIKIAEIHASQTDISGKNPIQNARKYYSKALMYDKENSRALWGLVHCCMRIQDAGHDDQLNHELMTKAKQKLGQLYTEKGIEVPELLK